MALGNGSHPEGKVSPVIALGPDGVSISADDDKRIRPEELPFYQDMMRSLEVQDRYAVEDPEEFDTAPTVDPPTPSQPFAVLGHDHSAFYYLPHRSRQVVELSAGGHTALNLLQLADLSWWARHYPGKRTPVSWDTAADTLIRASHTKGIFDPARLRGRGAWWDAGRAVEHVGSHLYVDGAAIQIPAFDTRYVYEAGSSTEEPREVPLSPLRPTDAVRLIRVCELLPWERPVNAKLFAGWIVCAMICGALKWRPHIWVSGSKGSGKTWVLQNIAAPALGMHCLQVESNTTEAGIRAALGHDALPVIFDEAEPKDPQAAQRVQNVLMLMRSASSSQASQIIKGSASGNAVRYQIRSCFAFASISVAANQAADSSRISVLNLYQRKTGGQEAFEILKREAAGLLNEDFCARLHIRAVRMMAAIRRNAEIFATEAAKVFGDQRAGDQLGALLAGAWSLAKDTDVTPAIAAEFISAQEWTEESRQSEVSDESACLSHICESMVRVEHGALSSIGALIRDAMGMPLGKSEDVLRDHGIRIIHAPESTVATPRRELVISNTHSAVRQILRGTPWEHGHGRLLCRLEGARSTDPMRFGDMAGVSRGVAIPVRHLE